MESRRDTLRIIGAIGTTCAFPFSADELYGQHTHPAAGAGAASPAEPFQPKFFTKAEAATLERLTDLIIPPTDTAGASAAGVPQYIDTVVLMNEEHQKRYRAGLEWLDREASRRFGARFVELSEERQVAILTPLCQAADSGKAESLPELFFRSLKNMTADGYYTSQIGLVRELGYSGNTVLARFPEATLREH